MVDQAKHLVPVIAPNGQRGMIAADRLAQALRAGGRLGVMMQRPNGDYGIVDPNRVEAAMQAGGKMVQDDGTPYAPDEEPVIIGHNAAGEPMWGRYADLPAGKRFLNAALGVVKDAASGMFDARPNAEEKQEGLTTNFDFWMRPLERMGEGHIDLAEQASHEIKSGDYRRGVAHGLLTLIPMLGPWAAGAEDDYYRHLEQGDVAGAIGSLGGQAAVAAAMEGVEHSPQMLSAAKDMATTLPARWHEFQAPAAELDKTPSGQTMSPRERWQAANEMGVNLDRAQATGGASIPSTAKRVTEESLAGRGKFGENNAANIEALHQHVQELQDAAGPAMGREEFGATMKRALGEHRTQLVDEPGLRKEAQGLLNRIDKRDMDGQQYGADAQEALQKHQDQMYDKAGEFLTDALQRKNAFVGGENVETLADKILGEESEYYSAHRSALKLPGVQKALDQLLPLASSDARVAWYKAIGKDAEAKAEAEARTPSTVRHDTPRNVATLRSDLWNLYQSPEIVKTRPQGWLKQLVGVLDESLTDPENERGMTPADIQKFRAGTSLWKRMKSMYDDPQSPFFSILRSREPKTVAGTLEKLGPKAATQFRKAMHDVGRDDLVHQQQRQIVRHILDPNEDGVPDFNGLAARYERIPKENLGELLEREHLNALGSLAKRTKTETPYDTFPHLKQVVEAPDGQAASLAMFADNGALRLTPAEVREIEHARPDLMPLLRRQTIDRLVQPEEKGAPNLQNFPSRWGRKADPSSAVLTDNQMKELDKVAEVSRTVHASSNPSGTARTLQPANELGGLIKTGATIGGAVLAHGAGDVGMAAGGMAGAAADTLGRGVIARRLVNPQATRAIMEHVKPPSLREIWRKAAQKRGLIAGTVDAMRHRPEDGGSFDPGGSAPPETPPPTASGGTSPALIPDLEQEPVAAATPPQPSAIPNAPVDTPPLRELFERATGGNANAATHFKEGVEPKPSTEPETPPLSTPTQETPPAPPTLKKRFAQVRENMQTPTTGQRIAPGGLGRMRLRDLKLDPKRFQYKLNTDVAGASNKLREVPWNDNLSGVVTVWRDPENGVDYVVNGHHRVDLAFRHGANDIAVKVLPNQVKTAAHARTVGALQNIAEGNGTATDAAKFLRDVTYTPENLAQYGISLSGPVAEGGAALSRLDPKFFDDVVAGRIPERRGIAIGRAAETPAQQEALLNMISRAEKKGRSVTNATIEELGRMVKGSPDISSTQDSLFGPETHTENAALEKAEASAYMRNQIASERKLFSGLTNQSKAKMLENAGKNKIDTERNAEVATGAGQAQELYDRLSTRTGPIDDILNEAAKRIAGGENANAVKSEAYGRIRTALSEALGAGKRETGPGIQGNTPLSKAGQEQPAARTRGIEPITAHSDDLLKPVASTTELKSQDESVALPSTQSKSFTSTAPTLKDQFSQVVKRRNASSGAPGTPKAMPAPAAPVEREGISTPPPQNVVENTAVAEPNEVHDPARAAAELRGLEGKPPAQAVPAQRSNPVAPVSQPGGPAKPAEGVIQTGTSTSEQNKSKATLEPPPGATHEVLGQNGELLGHMVGGEDGEYVPLEAVA